MAAVRWWAPDAVVRSNGSLQVTSGDRMYRSMYIYSAGSAVTVDVRGSKVASLVGQYHAAIKRYLEHGDEAALLRFKGKMVGGFELEADLDVIDELARRGGFDFESIYRMVD